MRILFILFVIAHCPAVFSQTNVQAELDFQFYDPNIRLYAIGESHTDDNSDLHLGILHYLQENTQINVVILELSEEMVKIINAYVRDGNMKPQMEELLALLGNTSEENKIALINDLRKYNLSVSDDRKISVIGIDFYSSNIFHSQMKALQIIFPELKNVNRPLVQGYIVKGRKKHSSSKKGKAIVSLLIEDATENKKQYESQLGIRTTEYMRQLELIQLNYIKNWRRSDSVRESILSHNLNTIIDSNKVSVLICGAMHSLNKEHDSWFHGYPFTSMLATAKSRYPGQTFSIVTQYYDKKLFRFFGEFNLLSNPNALYFEDRTKRYEVLTKEELKQHPKADARCDMVIVQNTRWKKRKNR